MDRVSLIPTLEGMDNGVQGDALDAGGRERPFHSVREYASHAKISTRQIAKAEIPPNYNI
jgi:hypothetical protein